MTEGWACRAVHCRYIAEPDFNRNIMITLVFLLHISCRIEKIGCPTVSTPQSIGYWHKVLYITGDGHSQPRLKVNHTALWTIRVTSSYKSCTTRRETFRSRDILVRISLHWNSMPVSIELYAMAEKPPICKNESNISWGAVSEGWRIES